MKKFLLFLLIASCFRVSAQNVGIGTVSPQAKVHVVPDNAAGILLSPYGVNAGQTGELRFSGITGAGFVAIKAPDNTSVPFSMTLPGTDGTTGQALTTNGSGRLQWATMSSNPSGPGCCLPPYISNESPGNLNIGQMLQFCDTLTEGGYTDWHLPTLEELYHATGGTATVPGIRSTNWLRTITPPSGQSDWLYMVRLSDGYLNYSSPITTNNAYVCRCVR